MEVICLEDAAYFALLDQVMERVKEKFDKTEKWISHEEAMHKLEIMHKESS